MKEQYNIGQKGIVSTHIDSSLERGWIKLISDRINRGEFSCDVFHVVMHCFISDPRSLMTGIRKLIYHSSKSHLTACKFAWPTTEKKTALEKIKARGD